MRLFNIVFGTATVLLSAALLSCGGNDNPKEGEVVTVDANDAAFEMVYVAPGTFTMGATPEHEGIDTFTELPTHKVTLTKGFFIGLNEVTQEQWEAVMGNNPSSQKEYNGETDKSLPVMDITWADAKKFVKKLSEMTGKKFRLPTEAEWEYAARGAGKSYERQFSGSQYLENVACFRSNSNGTAHPVGQFAPNELGMHDMSGNISEWVEDNFEKYKDSLQVDPCVVISDTLYHVARGGSFAHKMVQCRTASREYHAPDFSSSIVGLRLVMEKE